MIIGIQMGATSGVAVYDKGKIVYAVSEERFTRKKNDSGYPINALKRAIEVCNITSETVEKVLCASTKITPDSLVLDVGSFEIEDYLKAQNEYWKPKLLNERMIARDFFDVFPEKVKNTPYPDLYNRIRGLPEEERERVYNEWRVEKISSDLSISTSKVELINHDFAHAAYGLYGSRFDNKEEVLIVVYDGYSDDGNASIYTYKAGRLYQEAVYTNYNVGRFYRYITLLLGMKQDEHEYKVMGLAPYATEWIYRKPLEVMRKAYQFAEGRVIVDPDLRDNFFYFKKKFEGMRFDGIAAAVQIHTEELNKALIEYWMKKCRKSKLAISGGVSMNIKANMEIGKSELVKEIFVPGSGGDESLCIGAIFAYLDQNGRSEEILPFETLYLGDRAIDTDDILGKVDKNKYTIIEEANPNYIATQLADGLILGRVCGKMEFGARALGNRSILADPRERETIDKINKKIKSRDFWMPFTPSIIEEDEEKYLNNPKRFMFPWMSVGSETTDFARKNIKAAIHPADYTARPQIVTKTSNKGYYEIIEAFKALTGIGVLLNTSLNIHGYPIVRTRQEAYKVLESTDLDGLILDDCLILKR